MEARHLGTQVTDGHTYEYFAHDDRDVFQQKDGGVFVWFCSLPSWERNLHMVCNAPRSTQLALSIRGVSIKAGDPVVCHDRRGVVSEIFENHKFTIRFDGDKQPTYWFDPQTDADAIQLPSRS
jgi:hypothetical protein